MSANPSVSSAELERQKNAAIEKMAEIERKYADKSDKATSSSQSTEKHNSNSQQGGNR